MSGFHTHKVQTNATQFQLFWILVQASTRGFGITFTMIIMLSYLAYTELFAIESNWN